MERKGEVTFKGNPMTLEGDEVKEGERAPDFTAVTTDLKPVSLKDFAGSVLVISVVPSIDTSVCAEQTKRFEREAEALEADVLTISMDLPFAQRRFKDEHGLKGIIFASDAKDRDFGQKYGLYVKELGLLARAVLVIDGEGKIVHKQLIREIAESPSYGPVLEAVKKLAVRAEGC